MVSDIAGNCNIEIRSKRINKSREILLFKKGRITRAHQEKFLLAVVQRIDKSAEWALPLSGADVSVHRNTICDFGAGADEQNLSKFAQIACNSGCHRHSINCKQHFVRAKTRAIAAGKDYRIQHESQTIAGDLDRVALKIADTS
jgi:hypothetical protein